MKINTVASNTSYKGIDLSTYVIKSGVLSYNSTYRFLWINFTSKRSTDSLISGLSRSKFRAEDTCSYNKNNLRIYLKINLLLSLIYWYIYNQFELNLNFILSLFVYDGIRLPSYWHQYIVKISQILEKLNHSKFFLS